MRDDLSEEAHPAGAEIRPHPCPLFQSPKGCPEDQGLQGRLHRLRKMREGRPGKHAHGLRRLAGEDQLREPAR